MTRSILLFSLMAAFSGFSAQAQTPNALDLQREIQNLERTDCSDLSDKGQGQAAVACEEWRLSEITRKQLELKKLRDQDLQIHSKPATSSNGSTYFHEFSGEAAR